MPRYQGKVFTYAGAKNRGADLLFSDISDYDVHKVTEEMVETIAKDPTVQEVLGPYFLVIPTSNFILVTSHNIKSLITDILDDTEYLYVPVGICEDSRIKIQKVTQIYSSCPLPEKYILGCKHCLSMGTESICALKQFEDILCSTAPHECLEPETLREEWKPQKTQVAGFTLVSPALTSRDHITPYFRGPNLHDFSYVNTHSSIRSGALKERARINRFKKETCGNCFVKEECWGEDYTGWEVKRCSGNYPWSEKETAKILLKSIGIPYTDKQLSFLLANSGELDSRIEHKKWWATFMMVDYKLKFVLRRVTRPREYTQRVFDNFQEAERCIRLHNEPVITPEKSYRLTAVEKATLVELLTHEFSPTRRGGWHKTEYPLLGVEFSPYSRQFKTHYRYTRGSKTLPWHVEVADLKDIYKFYGYIRFTSKIGH